MMPNYASIVDLITDGVLYLELTSNLPKAQNSYISQIFLHTRIAEYIIQTNEASEQA
jgi:hypothetical protein